jgi:hypothetical protein
MNSISQFTSVFVLLNNEYSLLILTNTQFITLAAIYRYFTTLIHAADMRSDHGSSFWYDCDII